MKYIGIDYGKAKVGLALGNNTLASPLKVIRFSSDKELLEKIMDIVKEENIEVVVVGISENSSASDAEGFADILRMKTGLVVELSDETLSTHDANQYAIAAGIGREKRKRMEDAYAATIILQEYLDNL